MSEKSGTSGVASRLAAAAASIAKGASVGGAHGAVAGAVTSFLPEIFKLAAILIALLLLIPFAVFVALPSYLFGFPASESVEVQEMTALAAGADSVFGKIEDFIEETVASIILDYKDKYTDDEDGPEYDETDIITDIGNTNLYWFIAITSVYHRQNLYTMDEASILQMALSMLTSSASLLEESTEEGDDGEEETTITLKIEIRDLLPHAFMTLLGFTDEQRNWAEVLYHSMAQDQELDYSFSDGDGYYDTDYGDIVFRDTAINVVYYNQTDARWGNLMYGRTNTIGKAGCGPTALAMAMATFGDSGITPKETAAWSVENKHRAEGSGSWHRLIPLGGEHYGLSVEALGRDAQKVVEALSQGKLVVAAMSKGHFTSGGHFIVLRGMTADGNILVADPASVKRSGQEWPLRLIVNEANRDAGAGGPFWALGEG